MTGEDHEVIEAASGRCGILILHMLAEGVLPDVVLSGVIGQIEAFMFAQERRHTAIHKACLLINKIDIQRAVGTPCFQRLRVIRLSKAPMEIDFPLVPGGVSKV